MPEPQTLFYPPVTLTLTTLGKKERKLKPDLPRSEETERLAVVV